MELWVVLVFRMLCWLHIFAGVSGAVECMALLACCGCAVAPQIRAAAHL
jgi:hypothetical protein